MTGADLHTSDRQDFPEGQREMMAAISREKPHATASSPPSTPAAFRSPETPASTKRNSSMTNPTTAQLAALAEARRIAIAAVRAAVDTEALKALHPQCAAKSTASPTPSPPSPPSPS
jgi:hypothetical protein